MARKPSLSWEQQVRLLLREHRRQPVGPAIYRAHGIGRRGAVGPTDLELHHGEIVGFAGLFGSGRTELASLVSGVEKPDSGEVLIDGEPARISDPVSGLRHRIAHSSENRREDGIIGDLSLRENLVLGLQALRGWAHPLSAAEKIGEVSNGPWLTVDTIVEMIAADRDDDDLDDD
ncbi:ATP-binding cassette domain-containing protein [Rathayibacter rathayi]|uniref:ATP-binding cassette domain-containing protein n=1 Tax=Rathayibacter rathayi TaxID=33887 RepID=UPI000CE7D280|nr:ATP-binding cassette domain-containing protein [Rathayibacter rathayi]PPG69232.1 hypothetical protein C5C02_06770 [Rathayibacter rathayi]PPG73647.1 hypothetical protein C5C23_14340 [Rathayibacter rathayi]PPI75202.1 hypothetical protein C5E03_14550 [Rathayibacter rathayi]